MIILGSGIWLVVGTFVWLIRTPTSGFSPIPQVISDADNNLAASDMTRNEMIATIQFWLLFCMFFTGSSTGLIFISVASDLGKKALGTWAFLAVVVLSFGNTAGRLLSGLISDKYGANHTLFPATCKDYYGINTSGLNYGLLFTAFGIAGLLMPWFNGLLQDITGKPDISYIIIICMMVASALFALVSIRLGPPRTS
jgi:predicted MFS family arabinose efflux permease